MRRARWAVIESTPGYLPDVEPALFTNRKDAERYAVEHVRIMREVGYRVKGSAREGFYEAVHRDAEGYFAVRHVEILPVEHEVYLDEYGEVVEVASHA